MSDAVSKAVNGVVVTRSPWGPWVIVSKKSGASDRVVVMRHRLVTISGNIVTTTTPCTLVSSGLGGHHPSPVDLWAEIFGAVHWDEVPTSVTTPFTTNFPEFQFGYMFFDPPEALPQWLVDPMPPIVRGAQVRCETRWIDRVSGVRKSSATFDGKPYKHNKIIHTSKLTPGPHVFAFDVNTGGKTESHFQLRFSVIEPVMMTIEKPDKFDLDKHLDRLATKRSRSVHRQSYTVVVKNQAAYDMPVFPVLTSVPAGWMACLEGEPYAMVKAGRTKKWKVTLEFSFPWGISKEKHIQIGVAAGAGGVLGHSGVQSCCASIDIPIKASVANRNKLAKIEQAANKNYRNIPKTKISTNA